MKHTPGPWSMLHENDGDIWVLGNDKNRAALCRMLPKKNKYTHGKTLETIDLTSENIANAKLIAAAPDLLMALDGIMTLLVDDCECDKGHNTDCRFCYARNAIQKATGD